MVMSNKDYKDHFMEKKRIVMIDDDEDDFLLLSSGFYTFAPDVTLIWFDSPQAFLSARCWEQHPIHLLVLDLYLGPETGKHWQPELLAHECCQRVPIVVYSGSEAPGDRQEMMALGATDFIEKGADIRHMQQVITRMMAQLP